MKKMKDDYDDQLTDAKKMKSYDVFMSKPDTVMKQYLSKESWEEYREMTCDKGISFKSIVFPGIKQFENKEYTLCASSLSCYKIYHKLFERYL